MLSFLAGFFGRITLQVTSMVTRIECVACARVFCVCFLSSSVRVMPDSSAAGDAFWPRCPFVNVGRHGMTDFSYAREEQLAYISTYIPCL